MWKDANLVSFYSAAFPLQGWQRPRPSQNENKYCSVFSAVELSFIFCKSASASGFSSLMLSPRHMLQGLAALQGNKLFLMLLEHHHSTLWSALPGRSGQTAGTIPF